MIAESSTAALACTMSCVSFEIIPDGLPFFGFTTIKRVSPPDENQDDMIRTVVMQISDKLREVLCRLLVQVGDGDTSGKDGIVGVFGGEVCSSL